MSFKFGEFLILFGLFLIVVGFFFVSGLKIPLGKLPGDIYIEKENFKFYFPLTTCLLISIIFSLIFYLFLKFLK